MNEENKQLSLPCIRKSQLAELFFPDNTRKTALKEFNRMIKKNTQLCKELTDDGVTTRTRIYTPRQVRMIYKHLVS